jgi:hypothetical protein
MTKPQMGRAFARTNGEGTAASRYEPSPVSLSEQVTSGSKTAFSTLDYRVAPSTYVVLKRGPCADFGLEEWVRARSSRHDDA